MAQVAKAPQVKGQTDHLGRACRSTRVEPFIPTAMCKPNKLMYSWILLNTCSLIDLFCNQSYVHNMHQVNTTLSLATNAGVMMTNLKAEFAWLWHCMVYPSSHDKCAKFPQHSQTVSHLIPRRI